MRTDISGPTSQPADLEGKLVQDPASRFQDLSLFTLEHDFRGRSAILVQLWWIVQSTMFGCSPQFMYGWRRFLLRLFGAEIGSNVLVRPSVRVTYPWKLKIGNHSWIGDNVELYTLGPITIGNNAVVSQGSYLCTGTHDYRDLGFKIEARPIVVEDEAWIAAQVFVTPGIRIGRGAVVGARSLVLTDVPDGAIAMGHPATLRGVRLPQNMEKSGTPVATDSRRP
jgi:putative colanic acid biosynthesis acetyltransferase WcaF